MINVTKSDDTQGEELAELVANWTERARRINALVGRTIPVTTVPVSTFTHHKNRTRRAP